MGVVYLARDEDGCGVALKVLKGNAPIDHITRFRREAEAIARLRHPAIVRVHDIGVDRGRPRRGARLGLYTRRALTARARSESST